MRAAHPEDMAAAVLIATAAQLLDLATFARMVTLHGPGTEANPIVSTLLADHGLPFVAVAKLAALSLVVAIIVVLAGRDGKARYRRLAGMVALVAIVGGIVGGASNVLVLV